jgi:hypothetical protein
MTPDNAGYMVAAYALAAVIYLGYVVSLVVRARRLRERLARLDAASSRSAGSEGA